MSQTQLPDGTLVAALVVVNALGDILNPQTQQVIAGASNPSGQVFLATNPFSNTTIAVVATNASLTKNEANKMAQMAHNGIALTIRPAHTMFDGDTIFALALGPHLSTGQDYNNGSRTDQYIGHHSSDDTRASNCQSSACST